MAAALFLPVALLSLVQVPRAEPFVPFKCFHLEGMGGLFLHLGVVQQLLNGHLPLWLQSKPCWCASCGGSRGP